MDIWVLVGKENRVLPYTNWHPRTEDARDKNELAVILWHSCFSELGLVDEKSGKPPCCIVMDRGGCRRDTFTEPHSQTSTHQISTISPTRQGPNICLVPLVKRQVTSAGVGWSLLGMNTLWDAQHGWLLTDRPSPGISMNNWTSSPVATSVFAFSPRHHCLCEQAPPLHEVWKFGWDSLTFWEPTRARLLYTRVEIYFPPNRSYMKSRCVKIYFLTKRSEAWYPWMKSVSRTSEVLSLETLTGIHHLETLVDMLRFSRHKIDLSTCLSKKLQELILLILYEEKLGVARLEAT